MPKHFFSKVSFFIVSIWVANIHYAWIGLRSFFTLHLSPHWKINMSPENGPFQKESIVFQAAVFKRQLLVFRGKNTLIESSFTTWNLNLDVPGS